MPMCINVTDLIGIKTHEIHFKIELNFTSKISPDTPVIQVEREREVRDHFESIFVAFTSDVHTSILGLKLILLYLQQLLNP